MFSLTLFNTDFFFSVCRKPCWENIFTCLGHTDASRVPQQRGPGLMQVLDLSMGCRAGALVAKLHPENQNLEGNGEYKHLRTYRF